jgi:hypothetical protein
VGLFTRAFACLRETVATTLWAAKVGRVTLCAPIFYVRPAGRGLPALPNQPAIGRWLTFTNSFATVRLYRVGENAMRFG